MNYPGSRNSNWKGDNAKVTSGRSRALRNYNLGPCDECAAPGYDRHHKDGNTLNNAPSNIGILCRRCHMKEDGRLDNLSLLAAKGGAAKKALARTACDNCSQHHPPYRRGECSRCSQYRRKNGTPRPSRLW